MKFLIDENITPAVVAIFTRNGLHAHHINQFKSTKTQRIHDDQLRRLSLYREYVIVTRDDDFVSSYVSRKVPDQMIFIYNLDKKDILLDTFSRHIDKSPDWSGSTTFSKSMIRAYECLLPDRTCREL